MEITSVHLCLLRMGETGWQGGGCTLSRLAVPIKDVNERRNLYAAWHVRRCDVCMPLDTWTDRDNAQHAAVDIKALVNVDTVSRCVLPRPC